MCICFSLAAYKSLAVGLECILNHARLILQKFLQRSNLFPNLDY